MKKKKMKVTTFKIDENELKKYKKLSKKRKHPSFSYTLRMALEQLFGE